MQLFEFWSRLPNSETVHPDDKPDLAIGRHSFQFDLPPGHISGPILHAPVVICYGNPGYVDDDKRAAQDPAKRELLAQQRQGVSPYPMWLPSWKKWLCERTKQMNLSPERLSQTVATFNVVPYASVQMSDADTRVAKRLPSVEVAREYLHSVLIPKAKRQEIFLIVVRKHALWHVDGIPDSATLRIPRNLYVGGALGSLGAQVRSWLDARQQ